MLRGCAVDFCDRNLEALRAGAETAPWRGCLLSLPCKISPLKQCLISLASPLPNFRYRIRPRGNEHGPAYRQGIQDSELPQHR
jgi:hypothetical protein